MVGPAGLCTSYMWLADCRPMQGQAAACALSRAGMLQQCFDAAGRLLAPGLCCRQETVMQTASSSVGIAVAMLKLCMLLLPSGELSGAPCSLQM